MSGFFRPGNAPQREPQREPQRGLQRVPVAVPNHQSWTLSPTKSPDVRYTYSNVATVSSRDFHPQQYGENFYLLVGDHVLTVVPVNEIPPGLIGLADHQRTWLQCSLRDVLQARIFEPFSEGGPRTYIYSADIEISFAGRKSTADQLDQDELAQMFVHNFQNQIFAPGQRLIMDYKSIPLLLVIGTVSLADLSLEKTAEPASVTSPNARGILLQMSQLSFYKGPDSKVNLKASKKRGASNTILAPTFKFVSKHSHGVIHPVGLYMGIGGLDDEFATIFRRAFQSRLVPPHLLEQLAISHVKGLLLYGPPGTGKTLIARRLGQILNAREPKVVNGPEVLNKFVGQSEENIRKLFADAEKEYKEKGEESGLHIIIFDELDAVCKQRGSGSAGGTGVGDSVVNQLLAKLDGVEALPNVLLIGMTNRKDMIDDALLRPGRLEVHVEISLPDQHGRLQILAIHTASMAKTGRLNQDVSLEELAADTKNFSGAEISGLVRSATSWAINRHVKDGSMAQLKEDIDEVTVTRADFIQALDDIQPLFGASESQLQECVARGIVHYSEIIENILKQGELLVERVRLDNNFRTCTAIVHGPEGSGKTALAAQIAIGSDFPFIRMISHKDMVGFSDAMKVARIHQTFEDAYKSKLSFIVIDDIERLIGWIPGGPRFDSGVVQALFSLLEKDPPKERGLFVIATTSDRFALQHLGLFRKFEKEIAVPTVNKFEELGYILQESKDFDQQSIAQVIKALQSSGQTRLGVGIKDIYKNISTARMDKTDMVGQFIELMQNSMNTNHGLEH